MSSAIRPVVRAFVVNDETERQQMIGFMRSLVIVPKQPWRVVIEPDSRVRTPKQNSRMWSLLRYIAANAWVNDKQYSAEAWHHHYCGAMIGWEESPAGERVPIGTGTLNTKEHNNFLDRIIADAAQNMNVDFSHWDEKEQ